MILIDKIKTLVITPPKCGSTSAHDRWCQSDVGGKYVIGPQADGQIDKHTVAIPHHGRKFRIVCLDRDPYDRAVSLWSHHMRFNGAITFDAFIDVLNAGSNPFNLPVWSVVQSVSVDEWWPIESIDRISAANNLPMLGRLNKGDVNHTWTPDQHARVQPWVSRP